MWSPGYTLTTPRMSPFIFPLTLKSWSPGDPFGDWAASDDLPQLESQPDSEGEPCYCELYPHCGCDPAKDRVAMLDTPYAMLE